MNRREFLAKTPAVALCAAISTTPPSVEMWTVPCWHKWMDNQDDDAKRVIGEEVFFTSEAAERACQKCYGNRREWKDGTVKHACWCIAGRAKPGEPIAMRVAVLG